MLCLSDSSALSDIQQPRHALLVRFLRIIGHHLIYLKAQHEKTVHKETVLRSLYAI